jgi:hypothetical protein
MSAQLNNMENRLAKIDEIDSDVKGLKILLNDLKSENKQLKAEAKENEKKLQDMNERNNQLENRLNQLEQHHRGWSARAINIPLTQEEEANNYAVAEKVYNLLLLPILRGAVERKLLPEVIQLDQLLEVAHVLPGKPGERKPIIMRFYNRNVRDIIFRIKKFYAPRERPNNGGGGGGGGRGGHGGAAGGDAGGETEDAGGFEGRGKYMFPLYEDLSRAAFKKMRAIADDSRVKACWSVKGQLRFVLHRNPNEIKKVSSLLEPLDSILK